MKSKDVKTAIETKYGHGDGLTKIYRDLAEVVSLQSIKLWIKMISYTSSVNLSSPPGRLRTARTKVDIVKAKQCLDKKETGVSKKISC